ncbi:MAG: hypothetical protein A3F72_05235 [Bacteroidetes bacterium RIFCSPLOWO2_12_FULL_35_15]|nr:MAG: hypothetical protein A3F72_05235 [Bacteroidetes bacterium RIFCSPLOWO2_12_FULL_35_15]
MKSEKNLILTALDFSKCSDNALNYALKSYNDYNAKIIFLHAIQSGYIETNIEKLVDKDPKITKHNIENKLQTIISKKIKKYKSKCDYEIITEFSLPLDLILKTLHKVKPFFILLGSKKTISFVQNFFKNDTIKIIEQAKCPVIVIPEGVHYKKIQRITFATNYNGSDIISIQNLAEQANRFKVELLVLHISDGELTIDFELAMLNDFKNKVSKVTSYKNIAYKLIEGSDFDDIIKQELIPKKTDLFALSASLHHTWFSNLIENRITKILQQSKVPVMAYHYKGEKDNLYLTKLKDERTLQYSISN